MTDPVRDFYEKKYASTWSGPEYDSRFTKMWYKAFLRHIVPLIELPAGSCVVEVGAGKGYLAPALLKRGWDYTATDIAESALAQVPVGEHCRTVRTEGERLPFSDGCFDLAICQEVLEHVDSPERSIAECFRVVKVGGWLVFSSPSYLNGFLPIKLLADAGVGWAKRLLVLQIVDRTFMPWSLVRMIRRHGKILQRRGVRIAPPWFERLDARAPIFGDPVFAVENSCGHLFPFNLVGLHSLVLARKV